ncbi:sialidase family protein [Luteipulveratus mongoliensis]|uniref:Sialidase domain-containing protein n=1 Tax=Luteipulveratus mongoliensis TaxID=571913 RepID=A0A0K1JGA7_9MICO|nr:sialidase family protein [Luteipulveratus mongoliensis]AKU15742.1 hypothetical protein VV02_07575 [Luteipulveratus mongoliensis]
MLVTVEPNNVPPRVRIETPSSSVARVGADGSRVVVRGSLQSEVPPPFTAAASSSVVRDTALYEAFPFVVRHPDTGVMMGAWRTSATHVDNTGARCATSVSTNDGVTWSTPKIVNPGLGARDQGAAGVVPLPGGKFGLHFMAKAPYQGWFTTTADNGTTWSAPVEISRPAGTWFFPCGLARITDGTGSMVLLAIGYGGTGAVDVNSASTMVEVSRNGGLTWSHLATIGEQTAGTNRAYLEGQIVQSPTSGELVMLLRFEQGTGGGATTYRIMVSRSTDYGATWSVPSTALNGLAGQPTLCASRDGVLVTDLRVPEQDSSGAQTTGRHTWAYSRDDGRTWSVGGQFETGGRMGYGQFCQTAGSDLLAFYSVETTTNTNADIRTRRFSALSAADALVIYDYECPQETPVTYDDGYASSAPVTMPDVGKWLIPCSRPSLGCRFDTDKESLSAWERGETRSVLEIPGAKPFIVTRRSPGRSTSIDAFTYGAEDAQRIRAALLAPGSYFLSAPSRFWMLEGASYVDVSGVKETPRGIQKTPAWNWSMTLTEVERPIDLSTSLTGWDAMPDPPWMQTMPTSWAEMPA